MMIMKETSDEPLVVAAHFTPFVTSPDAAPSSVAQQHMSAPSVLQVAPSPRALHEHKKGILEITKRALP